MADYYPLISRAVGALEKNSGENRRAIYDRARAALLAQLRGVTPALDESDITRERLALEESIRKVEAESARQFVEAAQHGDRRVVPGALHLVDAQLLRRFVVEGEVRERAAHVDSDAVAHRCLCGGRHGQLRLAFSWRASLNSSTIRLRIHSIGGSSRKRGCQNSETSKLGIAMGIG